MGMKISNYKIYAKFPLCHSRENGNPVFLSGSRIKCGMTGGDGSPIRSALLSVEDDKGCVIPVKTGIQSE